MENNKIRQKLVKKIDSRLDMIKESTNNIIENLIELRSNVEEAMFLESLLSEIKEE